MLTKFLFELDDYQEEDEKMISPFEFLESFSKEEFEDGTVYHALSTIYNFTPLQIKDVVSHYLEQRDNPQ
jgi:hypothetical protein